MKPALLMVLASGLILTGCAGMKSEFDCNATASNGCMTMDEANNKARAMTENQKGKAAEGRRTLPPLAAVPVVKESHISSGVSSVTKPVAATATPGTTPRNPFRGHVAGAGHVAVTSAGVQVSPVWSDIGMARPVRLPSTTARMWIAAWVDEQAVWHQPSVVSFEVEPARWQHQEVKG
ncbi:type IV conjugative transfer system lipoprotein TraV [Escherichia coli]|jgi:conjugal transfer pilus assembly protein TraV|uniref:type IV conjugative transfer system lipoprotein TraV n=1 Tax=Escherichia coli TaxID=562 RepID=UPI000B7E19E5|nr:type IV conjugative transfer system lipoprotein TraV [Escherichia coli]EGN1958373.1 type IV conjugative transfer system lipoprotein TraV [Salmonella enterica]EFA4911358.1 type IV conjugative transfer system protein TraV [Escherichia coli]EFD5296672.1 type IV conjugative transfer system lipoprotein TraV [Escherichia coli]EFO3599118.1 type IV conjugative transfer system protein TraV [Escherichia coli]EFO3683176.1 type IV conjugative transfer system protein TraV [Escherichia coli]